MLLSDKFLMEGAQYAVIVHREGIERLLLAIDFDMKDVNRTAWIVPVPAESSRVKISVSPERPFYYGKDIIVEAGKGLGDLALAFSLNYFTSTAFSSAFATIYSQTLPQAGGGVEVNQHLEKLGLTMEVISASDGQAIYEYLRSRGLNVSNAAVPQLDGYAGKDYSFVVTWVSETEAVRRKPGILLEFPSEKIYYPLKPTSVYGETRVPTEIFVAGFVTPSIFENIKEYAKVTYRIEIEHSDIHSSELESFQLDFAAETDEGITQVTINAPSSHLTSDLWLEKKAPDRIRSAQWVRATFKSENWAIIGLLLPLLVAFIAGLIASIAAGMKMRGRGEFLLFLTLTLSVTGLVGFILMGAVLSKWRQDPKNSTYWGPLEFVSVSRLFLIFIFIIYWSVMASVYSHLRGMIFPFIAIFMLLLLISYFFNRFRIAPRKIPDPKKLRKFLPVHLGIYSIVMIAFFAIPHILLI